MIIGIYCCENRCISWSGGCSIVGYDVMFLVIGLVVGSFVIEVYVGVVWLKCWGWCCSSVSDVDIVGKVWSGNWIVVDYYVVILFGSY